MNKVKIKNRKTILPKRAGVPPENKKKNSRALVAKQSGQCKINIRKRIRSGYLVIHDPKENIEELEKAGIKRLLHDYEGQRARKEKTIILHDLGLGIQV